MIKRKAYLKVQCNVGKETCCLDPWSWLDDIEEEAKKPVIDEFWAEPIFPLVALLPGDGNTCTLAVRVRL